jgi:DNA-binding NarL/FixJ family response regulator
MSQLAHSAPIAASSDSQSAFRIVVVDDHAVFRHGLGLLIDGESDFSVCGEAESAADALTRVQELGPDIVITDFSLGGTNGIELVKSLKANDPDLMVIMLSMHEDPLYALRALRAGANAYVMKQEGATNVLVALRAVTQGEVYVSPRFREHLSFQPLQSPNSAQSSPIDRLSQREREVLQHLGAGESTREIAEALQLSIKTVETHRAHIKDKLNFRDSREMVRFAIEWSVQA